MTHYDPISLVTAFENQAVYKIAVVGNEGRRVHPQGVASRGVVWDQPYFSVDWVSLRFSVAIFTIILNLIICTGAWIYFVDVAEAWMYWQCRRLIT